MNHFDPFYWLSLAFRNCFVLVHRGRTAVLMLCSGCDVQRRKSDAELGLNPQQAAGRRIYDQYCDRCHEPYSSRDKKARSLHGSFQEAVPVGERNAGK